MCNRRSQVIVCILGALLAVSFASVASATTVTTTTGGTANYLPKFTTTSNIENSVIYQSGTKIGIGTTSPLNTLHVNSGTANNVVLFESTDPGAVILLRDNNTTATEAIGRAGDDLDLRTNLTPRLTVKGGTGRVGIATAEPLAKLDVRGAVNIRDGNGAAVITFGASGAWPNLCIRSDDDPTTYEPQSERFFVGGNGNVGIGTTAPSKKLTVRGNILIERSNGTAVMELGDGLDYAEGFDVAGSDKPQPGTVLVIDSSHPGRLTTSTKAYDTTVAGIAAGANNVDSGVRLGVGDFDCDVSLAGRVYCNVDATECAVQPGDLLTTSNTAGYAMKATDRARTPGAVLGKAMQSLEKGQKGQILVLVTLQ
jgi:hypothetical protein